MSASTRRIVVTVNSDGTVAAHTEGIHGEECVDRIETLEALLDAVTVDSRFTDDYKRVRDHRMQTIETVAEDTIGNGT